MLGASFMARATSYEVKWGIVPRIAALRQEVRLTALRTLRRFQCAYAAARDAWQLGDRRVVFPIGTCWMVVHHHALVDGSRDAA